MERAESQAILGRNTDQLVAQVREAHDIIKGIHPQHLFVSPAPTGGPGVPWLDEFLRKGGGQYVDVIGYHFYVFPQAPEAMVDLIQKVKQTMANNGASDKPLWGTEQGWAAPKPLPSDEVGAAYLARAYTLSWASGVSRTHWYSWYDHKWVSLETMEADNQAPKPAGQAYATIQQWLIGARMDSCNKGGDGTYTCQLSRDGAREWYCLECHRKQEFLGAVLVARKYGDTVARAGSAHEWISNSDWSHTTALERVITLVACFGQGIRLWRESNEVSMEVNSSGDI